MEGTFPENLTALGLAFRVQLLTDPVRIRQPALAGLLIGITGVVPNQRPEGGLPDVGILLQQPLEDPLIADHAGQTGHHALRGTLAIPGGLYHTVGVGQIFRTLRQVLDGGVIQTVALEVDQAGSALPFVDKGEQGIVGSDGLQILGFGHAPGKYFGIFPEVEAVIHNIALETGFIQGSCSKLLKKGRVQALLPHRQIFLDQFLRECHCGTPALMDFSSRRTGSTETRIMVSRPSVPWPDRLATMLYAQGP